MRKRISPELKWKIPKKNNISLTKLSIDTKNIHEIVKQVVQDKETIIVNANPTRYISQDK